MSLLVKNQNPTNKWVKLKRDTPESWGVWCYHEGWGWHLVEARNRVYYKTEAGALRAAARLKGCDKTLVVRVTEQWWLRESEKF